MKIKFKTACLAIATLTAPATAYAAAPAVSVSAGQPGFHDRLDLGNNSPRWGGEVARIVATIMPMRPNTETRRRPYRRVEPVGA